MVRNQTGHALQGGMQVHCVKLEGLCILIFGGLIGMGVQDYG